jgi:hypothetical protein
MYRPEEVSYFAERPILNVVTYLHCSSHSKVAWAHYARNIVGCQTKLLTALIISSLAGVCLALRIHFFRLLCNGLSKKNLSYLKN